MKSNPDREQSSWLPRLSREEDHLAWLWLWHQLHDPLLRLGMRVGLSHEEAEEALQETLITFHRDLKDGRYSAENGSMFGWIWRLGRWKCLEQQRKRPLDLRRRATVSEDLWLEISEPSWQAELNAQAIPDSRLESALRQLPGRISELEYGVFADLVFLRLDGETVAERRGISRNSVYLHKRHALSVLRQCWARGDEAGGDA